MKVQHYFFKPIVLIVVLFVFADAKTQQKVQPGGYTIPVYNYQQIESLFLPSADNDTTYIFNFWATYCSPCIKELPYFDQVGKEFGDKKLKIVLISLDFKFRIENGVIPFIKKRNIQSQVIVLSDPDTNTWIDKVSSTWTGAIPATLIVKGNLKEFYEKSFTYDELRLLTIKFLDK